MISNRTGKDPVTLASQHSQQPQRGSHPRSTHPRSERPSRLLRRLRLSLPRGRQALATALFAVLTAATGITTALHYQTPDAPLAAPRPVPTAVETLAQTQADQKKQHRFRNALHLTQLGGQFRNLHPIRTMERPFAALGNPLRGIATWYGSVLHGHKTASGETFDETRMTAAHKTLPLGTVVRVTNLRTLRSVIVRINDRGTLAPGRIIDLSSAAAEEIGMLRAGTAQVRLEILQKPAQS